MRCAPARRWQPPPALRGVAHRSVARASGRRGAVQGSRCGVLAAAEGRVMEHARQKVAVDGDAEHRESRPAQCACARWPAGGSRHAPPAWPASDRNPPSPSRLGHAAIEAHERRPGVSASISTWPVSGTKPASGSSARMRHSMAWPCRAISPWAAERLARGRRAICSRDQVEPGDHFGHRMFDLQPRVHLQEEEFAVGAER